MRGFKVLFKELEKYQNLHIGFEASRGHIVDFFRQYNFKLYNLNPLKVKRFKQAYLVSGNKSDKIDAQALAEYLRINYKKLKTLHFSSPEVEELNSLKISHSRLTKEHTRYTNRLIFLLREYFPLMDDLFSQSAPQILLKMLLKYPTWEILNKNEYGNIFKSLPGAGTILSAKFLAMIGDHEDRFKKSNELQCLFGTAPQNYESGTYKKVTMRRACNKRAKAILYQYAFSSIRMSKWAREYYDKQREIGKRHSVAVRALSNKWLKIIFVLWKNKQVYDENKKIKQLV